VHPTGIDPNKSVDIFSTKNVELLEERPGRVNLNAEKSPWQTCRGNWNKP
jgi:hypothetical protein